MTGLVGWWRRVEWAGSKEGVEIERKARLLEERESRQDCNLSCIRKFFPKTNQTPGGTCKLRGRGDIQPHGLTVKLGNVSNIVGAETEKERTTKILTHAHTIPRRQQQFSDNIFTATKKMSFL